MNRLEQLPTITNQKLGGLSATPNMLANIKLAAAQHTKPQKSHAIWRQALAVCTALLLCAGIFAYTSSTLAPKDAPLVLDSKPAGEQTEYTPAERALLNLPPGSISLTTGGDVPSYHNIFAEAQGANFPMVLVNGAAYRLLTTPSSVGDHLLGGSLGEVTEYTLEPALSAGGIVSNAVSSGKDVYEVSGMRGAMVAAQVDGTLRAFQRVSFAGTAIIGGETLESTLCSASAVASMELSDVGVIGDSAMAQSLMQTLLSDAVYQSASTSSSGSQSLLIHLQNGLTLQLIVGNDTVNACGSWSCPEFFEAFQAALTQ